jgi:hypothetical protein
MVTVVLATTRPEKDTVPAPIVGTRDPTGEPMSTPQCPAQRPTGSNRRTTDDGSGAMSPWHPTGGRTAMLMTAMATRSMAHGAAAAR